MTSNKPRILMYTPLASGGHAQYTWELLNALTEQAGDRYQFELVTSRNLDDRFHSDAYPIHNILPPLRARNSYKTLAHWGFSRLLHYPRRERFFTDWLRTQQNVAAVHFQEWAPLTASVMLKRVRAMGIRVFRTVHNIRMHQYDWCRPQFAIDRINRYDRRLCDGLFVLSDTLVGQLESFLGAGHPPIYVAPHGTWSVRPPDDRRSLLERMDDKKLLFFGTIRENKGLHLLLQAADLLPEYSITIAGEPLEKEYYQQTIVPMIRRLRGRGRKIDVLDHFVSDEVADELFASHSAVVLPYTSSFVAQSGVVYLALAHQLPVIASEAGGLRDLLDEYRIGSSFRTAQPAAIAETVRELCEHGDLWQVQEQMRRARQHYSWSNCALATSAAYDKVLNTKETDARVHESASLR